MYHALVKITTTVAKRAACCGNQQEAEQYIDKSIDALQYYNQKAQQMINRASNRESGDNLRKECVQRDMYISELKALKSKIIPMTAQ